MIRRFVTKVWDRTWKARQRKIDRQILWPSICEQAVSMDQAKRAMRKHMQYDSAYSNMGPGEKEDYLTEIGKEQRGRFPP